MSVSRVCIVLGLIVMIVLVSQLILWLPWLLGKTNRDFILPLGNGYRISRTNAGNCDILKEGQYVVRPNITEMEFHGNVLIGKAVKNSDNAESVGGYFILNIRDGSSSYGLIRNEWMKTLEEEYGISDYSLRPPPDAYGDWRPNQQIAEPERWSH